MPKFDPDAYLASNKPVNTKSGFDPDKYLSDRPQEEGEDTDFASKVRSAVRGFGDTLTMGYMDELAGGLESLTSDKTYEQARDEYRKLYKQSEAENPDIYTTGQAAGALAPALITGGGAAAPTLGKAIGRSALEGGAFALGSSEADLTKGEFGQAVMDTAMGVGLGGVAGGAFHGIGKGISKLRGVADDAGDALLSKAKSVADKEARRMAESEAASAAGRAGGEYQKAHRMIENADRLQQMPGEVGDELQQFIMSQDAVRMQEKLGAQVLNNAPAQMRAAEAAGAEAAYKRNMVDSRAAQLSEELRSTGRATKKATGALKRMFGLSNIAAGAGGAIGSALFGPLGGIAFGTLASGAVRHGAKLKNAIKDPAVMQQLGKYGKKMAKISPVLEKTLQEKGPKAVIAMNHVLEQTDPEYREMMAEMRNIAKNTPEDDLEE